MRAMSRRLVAGLVALIAIGAVFAYGLSKQDDVAKIDTKHVVVPPAGLHDVRRRRDRGLDARRQGVLLAQPARASRRSSTSGASWCPGCRKEAPDLRELRRRRSGRRPPMVGVAIDSPGRRRDAVRAQVGLALPDRQQALLLAQNKYGVIATPDHDRHRRPGRVVDRLIGPQTVARLEAELRALGAEAPLLLAEIALSPVGLSAAFAAGVISFLSPCVWPLVPAYLSYVSGVSFNDLGDQTRRVVIATAAFVLGFGTVFTLLGAGAGAIGDVLTEHRRALEIVSGVVIIAMGAVLVGWGGMLLQQERRLQPAAPARRPARRRDRRRGLRIGWTPCVGPTLAAILALAGRLGHALDGAILLAVYSLGLGVPFLLSGLLFTRGLASVAPLRRHMPLLIRFSGVVLMGLGVLLALGQMTALTSDLSSAFPALV